MPLAFAHSYNSCYNLNCSADYRTIEPLGKGWSHNYNCYIEKVDDEDAATPANFKTIITWGDGTMTSFIEDVSTHTWKPETAGTYGTLTLRLGDFVAHFVYLQNKRANQLSVRSLYD